MSRDSHAELVLTDLGSALRALRSSRGFSQSQLAERAQLQPSYIAGLERGERNATVLTLAKVLAALDSTPNELADALANVKRHRPTR
jgi:transcriptional regulator with XRE-family HTH domain